MKFKIKNIFNLRCPNCKSRDNTVKVYKTTFYVTKKVRTTGRQCNNCNNFWYN